MAFVITAAHPDDATTLGPLHLRNWLLHYLDADAGIDEAWIREQRASSADPEGVAEWREFIEAAHRQPELRFCRVVRDGTRIAGYLRGHRDDTVTLGPMYLLDHAQGHGLGGRLMTEFLAWAAPGRIRLGVADHNTGAIRFYQRHGFEISGERYLWRGRLPTLPMSRDVPSAADTA